MQGTAAGVEEPVQPRQGAVVGGVAEVGQSEHPPHPGLDDACLAEVEERRYAFGLVPCELGVTAQGVHLRASNVT